MNRKELARVMAARRGKTIQEAEKWESAMLDAMADALRKGEEVRLIGFGVLRGASRGGCAGKRRARSENACSHSDQGAQEDQIYAEPADFIKGKVGYDYEHRGSYCFRIRYWYHHWRLSRADDRRLVRGSRTRRLENRGRREYNKGRGFQ